MDSIESHMIEFYRVQVQWDELGFMFQLIRAKIRKAYTFVEFRTAEGSRHVIAFPYSHFPLSFGWTGWYQSERRSYDIHCSISYPAMELFLLIFLAFANPILCRKVNVTKEHETAFQRFKTTTNDLSRCLNATDSKIRKISSVAEAIVLKSKINVSFWK